MSLDTDERNVRLSTVLLDLDRIARAARRDFFRAWDSPEPTAPIGPFWPRAVLSFAEDLLAGEVGDPVSQMWLAFLAAQGVAESGPIPYSGRAPWRAAARVVGAAVGVTLSPAGEAGDS